MVHPADPLNKKPTKHLAAIRETKNSKKKNATFPSLSQLYPSYPHLANTIISIKDLHRVRPPYVQQSLPTLLPWLPVNRKKKHRSCQGYSNWKVDDTVPTYWFIIGPFTNLPFGICAIYFDLKVNKFRNYIPWQIHVTDVFTDPWMVEFYGINVGI